MLASAMAHVPCGGAVLLGDVSIPADCSGLVVFAHGSGSGRHSPRNKLVAQGLQQHGFATLLLDLLTEAEERVDLHTREHRFDIALLAERMVCATRWAADEPALKKLPVGYFGASTGSAAALVAAAELGPAVSAVVSRGGRPDLAGPAALQKVVSPTLLIVGGYDQAVIEMNEAAYGRMHCTRALKVIAGAGHLFEEAGTLERVADFAAGWFESHLAHAAMNA